MSDSFPHWEGVQRFPTLVFLVFSRFLRCANVGVGRGPSEVSALGKEKNALGSRGSGSQETMPLVVTCNIQHTAA